MTLATPEVLSWNRHNTSTSIGISAASGHPASSD